MKKEKCPDCGFGACKKCSAEYDRMDKLVKESEDREK